MKRFALFFLLLALALVACAGPQATTQPAAALAASTPTGTTLEQPTILPEPTRVVVFADDSLSNAFAQMAADVQAGHPGVIVDIRYGDAQALRKLIEQGAQADIYASADPAEMDALAAGKYVDAQAVNFFLVNQLVVVLPDQNSANITTLQDLAKPGVRVVLAAKDVTLGKYSQQALDKLDKALGAGYKDGVLKNVVSYEQDAGQALGKIQFGKADAAIVYVSDLASAPQLRSIQIPTESNQVSKYSMALLSKATRPDLAQLFVDYVLSPNGQAVLQKWGFLQDR